jgi:hypothetical protein
MAHDRTDGVKRRTFHYRNMEGDIQHILADNGEN